jgi:hypothetical protein
LSYTIRCPLAEALALAIAEIRRRYGLDLDQLASLTDTAADVLQSAADRNLPMPAAQSLLLALVDFGVDQALGNSVWETAES